MVPFSFFEDVIIVNNTTEYGFKEIEYAFNNSHVCLYGIEESHPYIIGLFVGPSDPNEYRNGNDNLAGIFIAKHKRLVLARIFTEGINNVLSSIDAYVKANREIL